MNLRARMLILVLSVGPWQVSALEYVIKNVSAYNIPVGTSLDHLDEWKKIEQKEIKSFNTHVARVGAAHDGRNLYLVYLVNDDSPLKNAGQDPVNHFKEGDNCDLMIGPYRVPVQELMEGDLRLLLTPTFPPVTTLYQPVMKAADPDLKTVFRSPIRTISMDYVSIVHDVDVHFGLLPGGYFCVAKVPFERLNIHYVPGLKVLFDIGVLSSNDGGRLTVRRAYLYNQFVSAVMDIPTEAELTPANWGTAIFE